MISHQIKEVATINSKARNLLHSDSEFSCRMRSGVIASPDLLQRATVCRRFALVTLSWVGEEFELKFSSATTSVLYNITCVLDPAKCAMIVFDYLLFPYFTNTMQVWGLPILFRNRSPTNIRLSSSVAILYLKKCYVFFLLNEKRRTAGQTAVKSSLSQFHTGSTFPMYLFRSAWRWRPRVSRSAFGYLWSWLVCIFTQKTQQSIVVYLLWSCEASLVIQIETPLALVRWK